MNDPYRMCSKCGGFAVDPDACANCAAKARRKATELRGALVSSDEQLQASIATIIDLRAALTSAERRIEEERELAAVATSALEPLERMNDALSAQHKEMRLALEEVTAQRDAALRELREADAHVLSHSRAQDHACVECVPYGPSVVPEFRCTFHKARARALAEGER